MQLYDILTKIREKQPFSLNILGITLNIFQCAYQEFCASISPEYSEDSRTYKNKEIDVFEIFLDAKEVLAIDGKNYFNQHF